ncbi:hypothetical protein CASFOL_005118 [Castilleja foliolosa]|uniref:F-box domain-containing protein n=1 Tax=Castilleja foliolosa TaxID=1961234 RepID=A0ABD3E6J9_9LAMI
MPVKKVALSDLPEEILFDIFSRLPTKSIGKFRTLSNTWRNLLSTPHFIKSHLVFQNTLHKSLILISPSPPAIRCVETISGDTVSRELELDLQGLCCELLGSCDGLVLLKNKEAEVFLVNPITMEQSKIPDAPVTVVNNNNTVLYGLGYDSVVDDYKVVAVFYLMPDNEILIDPDYIEPDYVDTLVYVYYVKTGVWKKIESSLLHFGLPVNFSGTLLNGAIHWLTSKSRDCAVIAALDLESEVYFEIPAPTVADVNNLFFGSLSVLGGCLCVIDPFSSNVKSDAWIMKDYGAAESWSKLTLSGSCFGDFCQPLCFIGGREEELVVLVQGPRLVVYNVKEGAFKDMVVDRVPGKFVGGGTFVESLVSPA